MRIDRVTDTEVHGTYFDIQRGTSRVHGGSADGLGEWRRVVRPEVAALVSLGPLPGSSADAAVIPDPSLTRMPRKELSVTLIDSATDR